MADAPKTLSLTIDGKTIDLHKPGADTAGLNKALTDSVNFKKFATDPANFAKDFGFDIDKAISTQLSDQLIGLSSVEEIMTRGAGRGGNEATIWAVASGVYSIRSTKIAVVV